MDDTLKQRLVGALVLLSAAVIFLPLIFDGRDQQEVYTDIQIPEEPVVTLDVTKPKIDKPHFEAVKAKIEQDRKAITPSEETLNQPVESLPPVEDPAVAAKQEIAEIKKSVEPAPTEEQNKTDQVSSDNLAEAYTVQLAAFSSHDNAEKLHKKLIEKNYPAYIQTGKSGDKTVYRVFVGPQLRKNRAAIIADALFKEFKLKGMVVRYSP